MAKDERLQSAFCLAFGLSDIDYGDMNTAMQSFHRFPNAWHDNPTRLIAVIDEALALPPETRYRHPVWSFLNRVMDGTQGEATPVGVLAASHHLLRSDALPSGKQSSTQPYDLSSVDILRIAFKIVLASWTDATDPNEVERIKETLTLAPTEAAQDASIVPPECAMPFIASPDYVNYAALAPALSGYDVDPVRLRNHVAACTDDDLHHVTRNTAAPAELLRDAFRRAESANLDEAKTGALLTAFWMTRDPKIVASLAHSSTFRSHLYKTSYYYWREYARPLQLADNADALRALFLGGVTPRSGLPEVSLVAIHNPEITDDECVTLIGDAIAYTKDCPNYEVDMPKWSHHVLTATRVTKRGTNLAVFIASTLPWHADIADAFSSLLRDPNLTVEQLNQIAAARRKTAKNTVLAEIKRRGAQVTEASETTPSTPRVEVAAPSFPSARDALLWVGGEYSFTAQGAVKGIQAALTNMETPVKVRQEIAGLLASILNSDPALITEINVDTWKLLFRFKSSIELDRDVLLAMMQCGDSEAERYAGKKIAESLAGV